jgi:predicted dehydrogenase
MKKNNSKKNSRRDFIKHGTLAASSFFIVPRYVLGGNGFTSPSDKINIAGIGVGGKGTSDLWYASNEGKENVVALCDVDKGNISSKSRSRFPKANFYQDYRVMFDKQKDIDAVTISSPDHVHALQALAAMDEGVHVYVQKPLTHNIKEARMLTETAREKKIVSQMGNQGASNSGMRKVQEWFDAGLIGEVDEVFVWTNRPVWPQGIPVPKSDGSPVPEGLDWDLWLGPAPKIDYTNAYHPFNWRGWWAYGTGALGDMGCHLIDVPFRTLGLHYPKAVECSVGQVFIKMWNPEYIPEGCPPSSSVTLDFAATDKNKIPLKMRWLDGGIRPPHPDLIPANDSLGTPDSSNGVMMIGSKGIITTGVYGFTPKLYRKGEDVVEFDTSNQPWLARQNKSRRYSLCRGNHCWPRKL